MLLLCVCRRRQWQVVDCQPLFAWTQLVLDFSPSTNFSSSLARPFRFSFEESRTIIACKFFLYPRDDCSTAATSLFKPRLHTHANGNIFPTTRNIFQLKSRVCVCWHCAAGSNGLWGNVCAVKHVKCDGEIHLHLHSPPRNSRPKYLSIKITSVIACEGYFTILPSCTGEMRAKR